MKQVIIMAAYYRVSTNLSVCVQCQVNFESTHHISSGNLKLMYFEPFYARVLPHPTARTGCSFFTVTLDAAAQGIHCCLAIFFVIYQISSKNLQQLPDDQSRSHFRCRFHFDFDFDLDSHSHSHSHFQSHSPAPATSHFHVHFHFDSDFHCEVSIKTKTWDTVGRCCDGACSSE